MEDVWWFSGRRRPQETEDDNLYTLRVRSPSVDRHRDELRPAFNAEPIFSDSYWNLQCDGWYGWYGWFFSCLNCSAIKSIDSMESKSKYTDIIYLIVQARSAFLSSQCLRSPAYE